MNRQQPTLALVIPCYNEQEVLPSTIAAISAALETMKNEQTIAANSFAVFVDDGSKDATWSIIADHGTKNSAIKGIRFSFNAGHQSALLAGMMESRELVDCIISIDADLQHDIAILPDMIKLFANGSDIVTGVRKNRAGDKAYKKIFSNFFYSIMHKLGSPLSDQHADFRLMGRNVLDALSCYSERNLFLRGIIASMGFISDSVPYQQKERSLGVSKYTLRKMASLAWDGITSFSAMPLRISAVLSLFTLLCSLLLAVSVVIDYLRGETVSGWSSLMISILFLGSIQFFCIAILGEYTAKIYLEVKRRPHYIIKERI